MTDVASLSAEIERLKKEVRDVKELLITQTDSRSVFRSINDPIDDDGSVVFQSQFFESGQKASASGDRSDTLRLKVGIAEGQDRLGRKGIINAVYGTTNTMINMGYDHLAPPAS